MSGLAKKTYRGPIGFKAETDDEGTFLAVFATMGVIDLDGDVTLPGAFGKQTVMIEPWNHNYQQLPVGRGTIDEADHDALVEGKFFLDTASGREHWQVVKELKDIQEWSYTFYILEAEYGQYDGKDVRFLKKLDVVGVGPVSRGAGVDTRVTDIKGKRPAGAEGEAGDGKLSGKGVGVYRTDIALMELED